MAFYRCGVDSGGGGGETVFPTIVNYDRSYDSIRWATSITSTESFSLKKGDMMIICVSCARTPIFPDGFTTIASNTAGSQTLAIAYLIIDTEETKKFTMRQSGEDKLGVEFIQLRNCNNIYATTDLNFSGEVNKYLPVRPFIIMLGGDTSNSTVIGITRGGSNDANSLINMGSDAYSYLKVCLNFGSYYDTLICFKGPGNIATCGAYFTES